MSPDETLTEAERALLRGDANAAEAVLSKAWPNLADAPADALHAMAQIRIAQMRYGEAEELLRAAVRAEPQSLRHNIALGHLLASGNDHVGAADAYAAAMRADRDWPGLIVDYAKACYRSGRYQEAEKAARVWIETMPSAGAYDTLSCALRMQNNAKDALAAADQALALEPSNAGAYHSRAAALVKLGRAAEALTAFDELIASGVHSPAIYLNRGTALKSLRRDQDAAAAFAEGARRFPEDRDLQQAYAASRR